MKMMNFMKNEQGQGLVEYVLILSLIALVVIVIMRALGNTLNNKFSKIKDVLNEVTASNAPEAAE